MGHPLHKGAVDRYRVCGAGAAPAAALRRRGRNAPA